MDFVFPRKEEGRRKEGRNNPHLAFSRRKDPTCLNFADCLVGVWRLSGRCLTGVRQVSGGCLKGVWKVPYVCLKGVWKVSMECPNGNLVSQG